MTAITTLVTVAAIGGGGGGAFTINRGWEWPAIKPYATIIQQVAAEQHIDPKLIAAIIMAESSGKERARKKMGRGLWAIGLMQVVANGPKFEDRPEEDALYDPRANVIWGCRVLRWGAYHHVPGLPDNQVITALYQYSGGSEWDNIDQFKRHYLNRVQYWYNVLFDTNLDVGGPLIQKPKPSQLAKPALGASRDSLTDILASVQDCADLMTETAAKLERYLQQ